MNYEQLTSARLAKHGQIADSSRQIQGLEAEFTQLRESTGRIQQTLQQVIRDKTSEGRELAIQAALAEPELLHKQSVIALREHQNKSIPLVSVDDVHNQIKEDNPDYSAVGSAIEQVQSLISEDMGDRFVFEYSNQIEQQLDRTDNIDVQRFMRNFPTMHAQIDRYVSRQKVNKIDKVSELVGNLYHKQLQNTRKGILILTGVLFAVVGTMVVFLSPIYLSFLLYTIYRNVNKGMLFSRTLLECKLIANDVASFDTKFREAAEQESAKQNLALKQTYDNELQELQQKERQLADRVMTTRKHIASSYTFDDTSLKQEASKQEARLNTRMQEVLTSITELKQQQDIYAKELKDIEKAIQQNVDDIKLKHMDFTRSGEAQLMDYRFLLDIKNSSPVFFDLPQSGAMFFYQEEDLKTPQKFVKLINAQLRSKISPHSYNVSFWDCQDMATAFGSFYKNSQSMVRICVSEDQIIEHIDELSELLVKRNEFVRKGNEYKNLNDYNQSMLELESMPDNYMFLYIFNPSAAILQKPKFLQLVKLGGAVGIHFYVFMGMQNVEIITKEILSNFWEYYEFKDDNVAKRAETFVLKRLLQFEE